MQNHGIRYGVMAGIASAILMFALNFIDGKTMLSWGGVAMWGITTFFMYKAGADTKRDNEGFMSWGEALKPTWITYAVGSLIFMALSFVLVNYIDPSLLDVQKDMQLEAGQKIADMFSMPEDAVEEMIEGIENDTSSSSIPKMALGWLGNLLIPGFIIAAILSLIVRNNRPGA